MSALGERHRSPGADVLRVMVAGVREHPRDERGRDVGGEGVDPRNGRIPSSGDAGVDASAD